MQRQSCSTKIDLSIMWRIYFKALIRKAEYCSLYYSPLRRIRRVMAIAHARKSSGVLIRSYKDTGMVYEKKKFKSLRLICHGRTFDVGISAEVYISPMPDDNETISKLFRLQGLSVDGEQISIEVLTIMYMSLQSTKEGVLGRHSELWHPYTISERVVTAIRMIKEMKVIKFQFKSAIMDCIERDINVLLSQPEEYGFHTCNHILNNARAIALAGDYLGKKRWVKLGAALAEKWATRLHLADGYLRERSVHYHLIVSNRLAEITIITRRHGISCIELYKVAEKQYGLNQKLIRYSECGGLPRFGDISPDETMKETMLRWKAGNHEGQYEEERRFERRPGYEWICDELLAVQVGRWTLFAHVPMAPFVRHPSHQQDDALCIELRHRSIPVLTFEGRGSYQKDLGDLINSYNSPRVNGVGLYWSKTRQNEGKLHLSTRLEVLNECDGVKLFLRGCGYNYCGVSLEIERRIEIREREVSISDSVLSTDSVTLSSTFMVADNVSLRQGCIKGSVRAEYPAGEVLRLELTDGQACTERGIIYESYGEKAEGFNMLKLSADGQAKSGYSFRIS